MYVMIIHIIRMILHFLFFNKFIYFLFINFWLRWVFVAARRLSLVVASRGCSSLQCLGFSLRWPLLLRSMGSRCVTLNSCGMRAQQLCHTGLLVLWPVGSSRARDWTSVPCTGRWIPNHCATREVPLHFLKASLNTKIPATIKLTFNLQVLNIVHF